MKKINGSHALLIGVMAVFIGAGLWGLDFGRHWDERYGLMGPVHNAIINKTILPAYYYYPSFIYDLQFFCLLPHVFGDGPLLAIFDSPSFLMRMRGITLVVSSLSIVWIFLWVRAWRKNEWEALVAAALFGLSWEMNYHSRWFTVDPFMVQFAALAMFFLQKAKNTGHVKWVWAGAAAAALSCASKYTAGVMLLPVLYRAWQLKPKAVLPAATVFFAIFFITSPGIILEWPIFLKDIKAISATYATGHSSYSVSNPFEHVYLILSYLLFVFFSKWGTLSFLMGLFGLLGLVFLIKEDRKEAFYFLLFPTVYLLYFSVQNVLVMRNMLMLAPFATVLAARGYGVVLKWCRRRLWMERGLFIIMGTVLSLNAVWLCKAADAIADRSRQNSIAQFLQYQKNHPKERISFSRRVSDELKEISTIPLNQAESYVFWAYEYVEDHWWRLITNHYQPHLRVFGPMEVNYNYYPTWPGDDRLIKVPAELALKMGVYAAAVRGEDQ